MLNGTEVRNLDVIRDAEAGKHEFLQPGDMRYWRSRPCYGASWDNTPSRMVVLRSEVRQSTASVSMISLAAAVFR